VVDVAETRPSPRLSGPFRPSFADGAAALAPLLRRLAAFAELTPAETGHVQGLLARRRRWRPGAVLLAEGAAGAQFLLSGWACSQRVLSDGRRQIFDLVLAGEGFGWSPFAEIPAQQAVVALTSVETIDAGPLLAAAGEGSQSGVWRGLRALAGEAEARRLDHMIRLGRLTASERVAHFILEMQRRTGAADARSFPLPLTQETMADVLGLSVVHLNRVLRQLRADRLVELRRGMALVSDARALAAAAFLPAVGDRAHAFR
jgi:CRP-like cAMP-binding protein